MKKPIKSLKIMILTQKIMILNAIFFGVAHFFVILTVYPKMPKDGVYKKRSNPNKETKHSYCDNPKSKARLTGRK